MDQRFPLQASLPSHQRTDSLPDLDMVPVNPGSASLSSTPNLDNPSQSSTSRSHSPESPSQIAPAPLPPRSSYSPQFGSSFSVPDIYHTNLLPPTIPNLEQPTPLTNPLPFQHEHRNQVPIEGEYPGSVPVQDDAILPAPPPYSRYAVGPSQKSDADRRRPQLEMIDVSAAVRGLPTVHIAVAPDGNVTSAGSSQPTSGNDIAPAESFVMQNSDSEVSMQSAQGSTFSANSNGLLIGGVISEKEKKKRKAKENKRVCGIKLWWILLAIAFVSILLSIVLGVTLGMVLKQNQKSKQPDGDHHDEPVFFPGGTVLVPLMLVSQSRTCLENNSTLPGLTGEVEKVLWACDLPGRHLHFEIAKNDFSGDAFPPALYPKAGTDDEAELVITSIDGAPKPMGPSFDGQQSMVYEGVQPPSFFHQPLYRVLEEHGLMKGRDFRRSADGSPKYEFRVLYTKELILRVSTIENLLVNVDYVNGLALDMGIESTQIESGEIVWWCEWEKTYIEGRVWMGAMDGISRKRSTGPVDPDFRITLQESRPSDQELQQLFPGSHTTEADKGAITCLKKMSNGRGGLVDIPVGEVGAGGNISSEINKANLLSEAHKQQTVEEVVRLNSKRRSARVLRRDFPQARPSERADGEGQCQCSWVRDTNI